MTLGFSAAGLPKDTPGPSQSLTGPKGAAFSFVRPPAAASRRDAVFHGEGSAAGRLCSLLPALGSRGVASTSCHAEGDRPENALRCKGLKIRLQLRAQYGERSARKEGGRADCGPTD